MWTEGEGDVRAWVLQGGFGGFRPLMGQWGCGKRHLAAFWLPRLPLQCIPFPLLNHSLGAEGGDPRPTCLLRCATCTAKVLSPGWQKNSSTFTSRPVSRVPTILSTQPTPGLHPETSLNTAREALAGRPVEASPPPLAFPPPALRAAPAAASDMSNVVTCTPSSSLPVRTTSVDGMW